MDFRFLRELLVRWWRSLQRTSAVNCCPSDIISKRFFGHKSLMEKVEINENYVPQRMGLRANAHDVPIENLGFSHEPLKHVLPDPYFL